MVNPLYAMNLRRLITVISIHRNKLPTVDRLLADSLRIFQLLGRESRRADPELSARSEQAVYVELTSRYRRRPTLWPVQDATGVGPAAPRIKRPSGPLLLTVDKKSSYAHKWSASHTRRVPVVWA